MPEPLGEIDYRRGGSERLSESALLLRQGYYTGSVYLAGRAAEGMLRAVIWKNDEHIRLNRKSLDTGHDLREMLMRIANLGVLVKQDYRASLGHDVLRISRLWSNNMRFWPKEKLSRHWWELREITEKRTLKVAALDFFDSSATIVKRCEILCKN